LDGFRRIERLIELFKQLFFCRPKLSYQRLRPRSLS
jgi:hypothetical protein